MVIELVDRESMKVNVCEKKENPGGSGQGLQPESCG